jgi:hypothetical protein
MTEALIKLLLNKILGTTKDQWAVVIDTVAKIAKEFKDVLTGEEKRAQVIVILKEQFPALKNYVINVLIEVAVAFLRKRA